MKTLLLALAILIGTSLLHSMEPQKQLPPITLPQTYHQLSQYPYLLPEITQHIFSFHLGGVNLATLAREIEQSCKDPQSLVKYIAALFNSCGYELSNELLKRLFLHAQISVCSIKDKYNWTALHRAACSNRIETVKLLLNAAGDNTWTLLTMKTTIGCTALHHACTNYIETVKLLLNAAGNNTLTLLTMKNANGWTALHSAASNGYTKIVGLLLDAAGNNAQTLLTMKSIYGETALHHAAYSGRIEIVKLLLDAAGDNAWTLLTMQNIHGETALHSAAFNSHTETVKLLLNAAGDNAQDLITISTKGKTAFYIARPEIQEIMQPYFQKNHQSSQETTNNCQFLRSEPKLLPEITQQIFSLQLKASGVDLTDLEQSCKNPQSFVTYLKSLLESCSYELASELLEQYFSHAKISMCDIKDQTNWATALHSAAINGYTKIGKLLLNAAGDNAWTLLTMQTTIGYTALHWAANTGHTEIVKLLLNAAGDNTWTLLTMQDNYGETALFYAVKQGNTETVKLLLNAAGDKVQDFMAMPAINGKTAFDIAKPEIQEIMKTYSQKANVGCSIF